MPASSSLPLRRTPRPGVGFSILAAVGLLAMCFVPEAKEHALTYLVGGPLVALATAVLILGATAGGMSSGVLLPWRGLGKISYAAYLWNYLILFWLQQASGDSVAGSVLSIPLTDIVTAWFSWVVVEKPALRLKDRLDARRPGSASSPVLSSPLPVSSRD